MESIGRNAHTGIFEFDAERRKFVFAFGTSLLLHILILLLAKTGVLPVGTDTIIIPIEEERRLVFEIVESFSENISAFPPDDAVLASDKNTRASDLNPESTPEENSPTIDGYAETKELPVPVPNPARNSQAQNFMPQKEFDLSQLKRKADGDTNVEEEMVKEQYDILQPVFPDNETVSARDIGNLSLSTYAWDFAPYMLELKRMINRNLNPPPAFTQLGIIDGKYVIQFVITRKGELKSLRLLDSVGADALAKTSIDAINYSRPFDPLPDHFPDEVLVITGTFIFYIR